MSLIAEGFALAQDLKLRTRSAATRILQGVKRMIVLLLLD